MKIYTCGVHSFDAIEQLELGGIHPHHEVLYLASGSYELEWLGGIRYSVTAPALFLIPSNALHRLHPKSDVHFWYIGLHDVGDGEFLGLNDLYRWNQIQCSPLSPVAKDEQLVLTLKCLTQLLESNSKSAHFHELAKCDVRKLIILIQSWLDVNPELSSDIFWNDGTVAGKTAEDLVNIVLDYMEAYFNRPLTLDELANRVHLNPSYLIRVFKKITGVTPMTYLTDLRMNAAICYLSSADMTIENIAERTGFGSIHHFSSLFKRRYGISPSHWRNTKMSSSDLAASSQA